MSKKTMFLDSERIADLTKGQWFNLNDTITFHGVRANIKWLQQNDLCFTTNPKQWGNRIPNSETELDSIFEKGASAAVITNQEIAKKSDRPILVVENSMKALYDIAYYMRDNMKVPRVLITGTEGKTGFKNQLYKLLSPQVSIHAKLDSSNIDIPILCSMASIGKDDKLEIVEASVANPGRGVTRSNLVKPDICVITEMGYAHVDIHGSIHNMIKNKAGIVDGLKKNGICIINATSVNYDKIREEIYKLKYVDLKTFGIDKKCNARVLKTNFNSKKFFWDIEADIEGIKVKYQVHLIGEHVPVSSLAPLLTVYHLGYDVKKAAKEFKHFRSTETMGKISKITTLDKEFYFFDHSQRAAILNYRSALKNLKRMNPKKSSKKIAVIGNMLEIDKISKKAHEDLAPLIEDANVDRLYTIGKLAKPIHSKLKNQSILINHADNYKEIENQIIDDIGDGDIIFLKGSSGAKLENLANKIYALGESSEV